MCACAHTCTHTHEYYSAIKKEWNLAICKNMEEPRGYYAKWNKSDGERQILHVFTYMWDLKICSNQKQTPLIQRKKLVDARGEEDGGKCKTGEGDTKRYKQPVT